MFQQNYCVGTWATNLSTDFWAGTRPKMCSIFTECELLTQLRSMDLVPLFWGPQPMHSHFVFLAAENATGLHPEPLSRVLAHVPDWICTVPLAYGLPRLLGDFSCSVFTVQAGDPWPPFQLQHWEELSFLCTTSSFSAAWAAAWGKVSGLSVHPAWDRACLGNPTHPAH